MKFPFYTFVALLSLTLSAATAESGFQHFITAKDGQLWDGDQPFRFISFNIPNLLMVEDNVPFAGQNPWRLADHYEINDALTSIQQLGGTVTRTYVITVVRTNDAPGVTRHVLGPGLFNEAAFRNLDEVLAAADRTQVRLIIPLVDNWPWMGGKAQYAGFHGQAKDDFWTDPDIIADFKKTVAFILTRTNTVTGIPYRDDKAILCWETGNEISSPPAWTQMMAAYIKSLDHNHLVMDGFGTSELRAASLDIPEVDIVTTHHYPGSHKSFSELITENCAQAHGRKPYIIGEFGFVPTADMATTLRTIRESDATGGLLWSLRFHNRDGGFYWHSEPGLGGNLYKAFHWPGSPLADAYDEVNLMALTRSNAFAIRGLPVPPVPVPAAPNLLPITDAAAISWQGSVGASSYRIERAAHKSGPWTVIDDLVDESATQYRPEFADETVPRGQWYYRVTARNPSGLSTPSNVVGPVKVRANTLVDELANFSKIQSRTGLWKIADRDGRQAKEDAQRAAGVAGSQLIYHLPARIQSFRVYALYPHDVAAVEFSVSTDGQTYQPVPVAHENYFQGVGDYGYWKPVRFHAEAVSGGTYLKIELKGETQIGRVEITHDLPP